MVAFRRSMTARCTVASLCSLRVRQRLGVTFAELARTRDARRGALVLARVVVPAVDQGGNAVFVGVDADRLVRSALADQQFDWPSQSVRPRAASSGLRWQAATCRRPRRRRHHCAATLASQSGVRLEGGFGGKRLERRIVGALLRRPVASRDACGVSSRQLLELAIGRPCCATA
jgi:hypothetical protein